MGFEFLFKNHFNTSTMANVNSSTISNILNREKTLQYITSGFNNDATTLTLTITFAQTQTVSRIALLNHNLRGFQIYYNGVTANTFALTTTSDTTTANYSSNSATSKYFTVPTTSVDSISIDMRTTVVANSEKAIGYLYIGTEHMQFDRDPSAKDYKPVIDPEQISHKLSDGGTRLHTLSEKYATKISFNHISESFRDEFKTVYDLRDPFWFCPFGTTTAWDGVFFECIWEGDFNFYKFSDNATAAGFSGSMSLKETPN